MKILLCTNAFENITNGPAKFANLVLKINDSYPEHQIRILTEDVSESELGALKYVYKVDLKIPGFLRVFGQILRMFIYYNKAWEIQQEYNYDVLVYINAFNGLWAAMVSDKPTIGMINDYNNLSATLSTYNTEPRWLKKFGFKQLERLSTKYHKAIISNSHYLTKRLIDTYQIEPQKVHMLYKAVDTSAIVFNPERKFSMPVKILFVKADYPTGGLHVLAKALYLLPSFTFLVTIIGPPERFREDILSLFANSPHVQVKLLSSQPQKVVYEYLAMNNIFCVPSLKEALGVANIEALASGIPVISTNTGGIPEVLDYGNNGWLVNINDPVSLAAAIKDCIEDPHKRLHQAMNGNKFIRKFSIDSMLHNFIRILENVLSGTHKN
jgi:colanic acid/amylovoran biosynthesis glycosyltransferase